MPGPAVFFHELQQFTLIRDKVMRRHFRARVAKPLQSFVTRRHFCVVKHDELWLQTVPPFPEIR